MTTVINFFAGPGAGKSTMASGLYSSMKMDGFSVEYVTEFPKDLTWEENATALSCQPYLIGEQFYRMWRLKEKVRYIVTDSPLLMYSTYNKHLNTNVFRTYCQELFNNFANLNFFIHRTKEYKQEGRTQTLEEAKDKDREVYVLLHDYSIRFMPTHCSPAAIASIKGMI